MEITGEQSDNRAMVDPRAPRFGQGLTATLLLVGVALWEPVVVYLVAAILVLSVLSGWRVDLYATLWRNVMVPFVGPTSHREAAAPHRFARLLGALGSTLAAIFLVFELAMIGFAVAAVIGLLAALAAVSGLCLGCMMYKQVSVLRRHDVV